MDNFEQLHKLGLQVVDVDLARFWHSNGPEIYETYRNPFIIDVGCGKGLNVNFMKQHFNDIDFNILGIDINKEAIDSSIGNCVLQDIMKMKDNICHMITDIECLVYIGEKGIKQAAKMLVPAGIIFSKMFIDFPRGVKWAKEIHPFDIEIPKKYFREVKIIYYLSRENLPNLSVKEICWMGIK